MAAMEISRDELTSHINNDGWIVFEQVDVDRFRSDILIYAKTDDSDDELVQDAIACIDLMQAMSVNDGDDIAVVYRKTDDVSLMPIGVIEEIVKSILSRAKALHKNNVSRRGMTPDESYDNVEYVYGHEVSAVVRSFGKKDEDIVFKVYVGDIDELISKHVESQVVVITSGGMVVDTNWRRGLKSNFLMLKGMIDSRDYFQLKEFLSIRNQSWRMFFEEYSGIKLPSTDRGTVELLARFAPFI